MPFQSGFAAADDFLRPDGVLNMPIEGRGRYLDPKQSPPKDRDIHLVEFKFCSDIKPATDIRKSAQPANKESPATH